MSMQEILETTKAALLDPSIGLIAQLDPVREELVRKDFVITPWKLQGPLADARQHNIAVMPADWDVEVSESDTAHRDADARVRIAFECFDSDAATIEATVLAFSLAVVKVVARLRAFSDATRGTIIEVGSRIRVVMGEFPGATSGGFTATFTLSERSTS